MYEITDQEALDEYTDSTVEKVTCVNCSHICFVDEAEKIPHECTHCGDNMYPQEYFDTLNRFHVSQISFDELTWMYLELKREMKKLKNVLEVFVKCHKE